MPKPTAARVGERKASRRGDGDGRGHQHGGTGATRFRRCPEGPAMPGQVSGDGQRDSHFLHVDALDEMGDGRADEQDEGDAPGSLLAPPDAPTEQEETETGECDHDRGALGDGQGYGLPQDVQPIPQRRCEGRDQVEDAGRSDGHRPPAAGALEPFGVGTMARAVPAGLGFDLGGCRHARSSEGSGPSATDPMKLTVSTM
jgi:hypothetical protein